VTPELLLERRIVSDLQDGLKVLGDGELGHPLTIRAHKFSKSALEKLSACGGAAEVIENA
jgi:large subunit ribosomal protein L15